MSIFNLKKEKSTEKKSTGENVSENINKSNSTSCLSIKILGSGCDKCDDLKNNTDEAIKELNINATVEHVEDLVEIVKYGVMSSPALVVNEKVVSLGRVLKKQEVEEILKKYI
ncbi:thioredoxin family protein [Sedimentibacter sp. zth1]|uniref:thioredoxin family protein n=1 Tax=Sedimentibacter sp. zth1 TaxID=2816908 RepID=UPI001A923A93|nr:thioredoxin family protein [Sedimentibacter sp. zth1]QSX05764.1 thioredoxin family protein [Sedimentibacter sp. zth1]